MRRQQLVVIVVVLALCVPGAPRPARAEPTADQILADIGLSVDERQQVMNGEFVTTRLASVSERDLPVALIVFVVTTSPDTLARQIMAGDFITTDPQVQMYGRFGAPGSLADLAGLKISGNVAQRLYSAQAGQAVNLATSEIAAFNALQSDAPPLVRAQLQRMLLARYQAYRASGLGGIAPYDRGSGRTTDLASDLRKASQSTRRFEKYMPAFHAVIIGYPQATLAGMPQDFRWVSYNIEGKSTYVLVHMLSTADGTARAIVQRHYYVSTGYNGAQAVAGFLPVQGGTLVVYAGHVFTDQVAGFGGAVKRRIGRRMLADKMRQIFEAGGTKLATSRAPARRRPTGPELPGDQPAGLGLGSQGSPKQEASIQQERCTCVGMVRLVHDWLDGCSGIGLILGGMTHQGWDVACTSGAVLVRVPAFG